MRNKYFAALAAGVFIGLFGWSGPVAAHVQTAGGSVSAVMHILPDDSPRAGEDTFVQFAFGGSGNDFDTGSCACELEVRDTKGVSSITPVEPVDGSSTASQARVVFPRAGVYDLTLRGTAGQGRFAIEYTVRIGPSGGTDNMPGGLDVILISLASLIGVSVTAYYVISGGARYTNPKAGK